MLLFLLCVSEAAFQYHRHIYTIRNCLFIRFSVTSVKPEKPLKMPEVKDSYKFVRCSATIVSIWHDTFWLMSDFVPIRGNISCQNRNMSTPLISRIHSFKQMQSCFNIPPERVQKQRNIFHPVILPYRYAKHNTYKAVSIQIIGTIMCSMVKEFWNILKPSAAENFLRRKNCYSFCNSRKTFI